MIKFIIMTLMALSLQGCASLNPLSMLSGTPSIGVSTAIGKDVQQEKNVLKVENGNTISKQEAETISNDIKTDIKATTVNQITNNMTIEHVLWFGGACFFIGWLAPDPLRIYKAAGIIINDILYGFIVNPIKGCIEYFRK